MDLDVLRKLVKVDGHRMYGVKAEINESELAAYGLSKREVRELLGKIDGGALYQTSNSIHCTRKAPTISHPKWPPLSTAVDF
jgi:hypothetical protein